MADSASVGFARTALVIAAISGLLCVAIGAFGAHGMNDPKPKEWIEIGSRYQMFHTLAVIAAIWLATRGAAFAGVSVWMFFAGILLFSGSLYAMAFGGPRILGAVTPIGGLAFMGGWAAFAFAAFKAFK
ncbi:MAG: DUF423 domain-containing protein [Caulobacterales bacterium]